MWLASSGAGGALGPVEAVLVGDGPFAGAPGEGAMVVRIGTLWRTADCTTDWMTKGLARTWRGGGRASCSMISDMACCA